MRFLLTGASGQIGEYLTHALLAQGYSVGVFGRTAPTRLVQKNSYTFYSTTEYVIKSFSHAVKSFRPNVVINLASMSSVWQCSANPEGSARINKDFPMEILRQLESNQLPFFRLIQASSSEMFSESRNAVIDETTDLNPGSIYGHHKAVVHQKILDMQRAKHPGIASIVLFNNESPLRSDAFVSKKIVKSLIDISFGKASSVSLGNLQAKRDWCHPSDTSVAIMKASLIKEDFNFVVGTGKLHSVSEFCEAVGELLNIKCVLNYIHIDAKLLRKSENSGLAANSSLIQSKLSWFPKYEFRDIVTEMVNFELRDVDSLK